MRVIISIILMVIAALVGFFFGAGMNEAMGGAILLSMITGFACTINAIEKNKKDWQLPVLRIEKIGICRISKSRFGKYKNVSHYGFNAVCKEKQYDWVCYMVTFGSVYNWIRNKRYVF